MEGPRIRVWEGLIVVFQGMYWQAMLSWMAVKKMMFEVTMMMMVGYFERVSVI